MRSIVPPTRFTAAAVFIISTTVGAAAHADSSAGKQVFNEWCSACHMDSPFAPGTIQLRQLRGPANAIIEQRSDLSEALVRLLVRQGVAGMPKFRRTEISETELEQLIVYLVKN